MIVTFKSQIYIILKNTLPVRFQATSVIFLQNVMTLIHKVSHSLLRNMLTIYVVFRLNGANSILSLLLLGGLGINRVHQRLVIISVTVD